MPILKSAGIDHIMNAIEDLIPFSFVLFYAHSLLLCESFGGHNGLLSVNPWGDKHRQIVGDVFTLFANRVERFNGSFGLSANFCADIPTFKALVVTVTLPHFIDNVAVIAYFMRHISCVPIVSRVVKSEIKLHVIFIGQAQKEVN